VPRQPACRTGTSKSHLRNWELDGATAGPKHRGERKSFRSGCRRRRQISKKPNRSITCAASFRLSVHFRPSTEGPLVPPPLMAPAEEYSPFRWAQRNRGRVPTRASGPKWLSCCQCLGAPCLSDSFSVLIPQAFARIRRFLRHPAMVLILPRTRGRRYRDAPTACHRRILPRT
jgi:hypothetical protein